MANTEGSLAESGFAAVLVQSQPASRKLCANGARGEPLPLVRGIRCNRRQILYRSAEFCYF